MSEKNQNNNNNSNFIIGLIINTIFLFISNVVIFGRPLNLTNIVSNIVQLTLLTIVSSLIVMIFYFLKGVIGSRPSKKNTVIAINILTFLTFLLSSIHKLKELY